MDTPEKKVQPSPSILSKFEDSPVYNYISNLSPITPYNSSRVGQSFHVFGFTPTQALQTSPPPDCPNESKIESGSNVCDVPKNNCSQNGSEEIISGTSGAVASTTLRIEEVDKSETQELTVSETDESSKKVIELPKSLKYDSGSPENSDCGAGQPDCQFYVAGTELSPMKVIQGVSQGADCSVEKEIGVQGIPFELHKQVCNWQKFLYEASDILNCQSPAKDKHQDEFDDGNVDSGTLSFVATVLQPPNDNTEGTQKLVSVFPVTSSNQHVEAPLSHSGQDKPNETNLMPAAKACAPFAEEVVHNPNTEVDEKQQMTRRRCLVYEVSGAHYRKLLSDPTDSPPTSKPFICPKIFTEKGKVASKPGGNTFSSQLPGIGLHLNALAAASREKIIVKRQTLTCRRQLISSPCPISSFDALTSDSKPVSTPMSPVIDQLSCNDVKDGVQVTGNVSQDSTLEEGTELYHNSPKKKRKKSEKVDETDSCKRCNCKRSKCLKLYCECFAAGLYCVGSCNCRDCLNKPVHEETVLETRRQIESRNPLAFAPKVIKFSGSQNNGDELKKTPASARHKRGCNCKKSGCLKKYCECFQGGVGCSLSCRCEGCKNTFGQKEGSEGIIFEETHIFKKSATDASSYNEVLETDEENLDQATPEPSNYLRQPVRRPFHFDGMASQFPSTLQSCKSQRTDKSDETAFKEDLNIAPEDEVPEMFESDYTLPTCVKSTSPNSKRVSPPHYGFEPSPAWRSCRKLILRSIPSLPSSIPEKKAPELQGHK